MIQDDNLSWEMRRFFDKLPEHYIDHKNEVIELTWSERGDDQEWHTRRVSNLDQAARMAVSLGPDHDVSILVRERPDGVTRAVGRTALLAVWEYRGRRPDDSYLRSDLDQVTLCYSAEWQCRVTVRQFPAGAGTCEATAFRHPYWPCRPVRRLRTETSREVDA